MAIIQGLAAQLPDDWKVVIALVGSGGIVALFSALLTTFALPQVNHQLNKRFVRHRLDTEYEYEQRKKLRDLIGSYHGRMLTAADILKPSLAHLYGLSKLFESTETDKWLEVKGENYQAVDFRFIRMVYRFLAVATLVQRFEAEAHYIDSRLAEDDDFRFLSYLKLLQKAATDIHLFEGDIDLFEGLDGNDIEKRIYMDTIRSDTLRILSDSYWMDDRFLNLNGFKSKVGRDHNLSPVLWFFANLGPKEKRLRWYRLAAFYFVLAGFINHFGYKHQKTEEKDLEKLLHQMKEAAIRKKLCRWFEEYGLTFPR